jgi:alkanesulfonate monooxygenase SsuD/methylene tetrahydromethanopterin reductase-like flavin-dependent oxidoreductase (luciferase family)
MRFGLWLPSFGTGTCLGRDAATLDAVRIAEAGRFDSAWVIDHPLAGAEIHATSWHDPLITLAAAAACSERLRLGTAVLVAGIRHPVALAKQLASLACLAGDRVVLGAASGWYAAEYAAFGYSIAERRSRTDECLAAVRRLLEEPVVDHRGRHWQFAAASIQPRPAWRVPILIGGGSRLAHAGSDRDVAHLAGSVLDRIERWEGWIAPCAGSQEATLADLRTVVERLSTSASRDGHELVHVQWVHVVDTDDRERALAEQLPAFRAAKGNEHSDEHLWQSFLLGSLDDIRARLVALAGAGFDEVVLGPVCRDRAQIELIDELLVGWFARARGR